MSGRGGYQKPSSPAPVSGPGRLAKRTDSQPVRSLSNADYGEQAEYRTLQQSAPLATTSGPPAASAAAMGGGGGAPALPGMADPTSRPDEVITTGADAGPGPGMASLGLPNQDQDVRMRLAAIYQAFPSEDLRRLLQRMG